MGGLLRVWAVRPAEITIEAGEVTFSTEDNIVALYCTDGTIGFSEQQQRDTKGNTYFKTELKAVVPKDSAEITAIAESMKDRRWVVIYLDQNEQFKVVGTSANGLHVTFDLDTGSDTPDRNGHLVTFYGNQKNKATAIADPF